MSSEIKYHMKRPLHIAKVALPEWLLRPYKFKHLQNIYCGIKGPIHLCFGIHIESCFRTVRSNDDPRLTLT